MWWMTVMHLYSDFRKRNILGIDRGLVFIPRMRKEGTLLFSRKLLTSTQLMENWSNLWFLWYKKYCQPAVFLIVLRNAPGCRWFCSFGSLLLWRIFVKQLFTTSLFDLPSLFFVLFSLSSLLLLLLLLQRQLQALRARLFRSSGSSHICLLDFQL
jgi:hypothetical protein